MRFSRLLSAFWQLSGDVHIYLLFYSSKTPTFRMTEIMARRTLYIGDPAPWFSCPSSNNPTFNFETIAGRYVVLSFVGSMQHAPSAAVVASVEGEFRPLFDDKKLCFFSVTTNPADEKSGRLQNMAPGIRHFWDHDYTVSRLYGALGDGEDANDNRYRHFTLVLDPLLRIYEVVVHVQDGSHMQRLRDILHALPEVDDHAAVSMSAPVLILPRVFEPDFCQELIGLYKKQGGIESGFMRQHGEQTVALLDNNFKRRKDFTFDIEEEFDALRGQIRARFKRRMIPEIFKAFQYKVTRIERYIVACYESETLGFFRAHRDNTTKGTAHRRFACSINLNAEEYEGGDLRFPEFGSRTYRAPTGGAVVFSCSLLHEATEVTQGTRYAFLPFLYDEAAVKIRDENRQYLSDGVINLNESGY